MTNRKLPSIMLSPVDHGDNTGREGTANGTAGVDLDDQRLYDGILGRRFCAVIIDFTLASVLSMALWLVTCAASVVTLGLLSVPAFLLAPIVIHAVMAGCLMSGSRGATIGMRALGLRVVTAEGRRIDTIQGFLMVAMYFATITIFFPVLAVAFFTQRARLLHDIVAGTTVIRASPETT